MSLPMTPFMMFLVFWIEVLVPRATQFFPASGICLLRRWEGQKLGSVARRILITWENDRHPLSTGSNKLFHCCIEQKRWGKFCDTSTNNLPMCVVGIATFRTLLMPCCCTGAMTSDDGRWFEGWSFFCAASEWLFDISVMLLSSMFIL